MGRKLKLNFTPLKFDGTALDLQTLAFDGPEKMKELRGRLRGRFAITRRGSDVIAIPTRGNAELVGEAKRVSLDEHLGYLKPLLEDRLIEFLRESRPIIRYDPITAIGRPVSTGSNELDGYLQLQSRLLISVRQIKTPNGQRLGLLWDVETQRSCPRTLLELKEAGFSVEGVTVEREWVPDDPRLTPSRRLLGRVSSIVGTRAHMLERFKDAPEDEELSSLYLEASWENIQRLKEFCSDAAARRVDVDQMVAAQGKGSVKLQQIKKISDWLRAKGPFELQPGLSAEIGDLLSEEQSDFPKFEEAPAPTYVFDAGTQRTEKRASAGLAKFGPYSRHVFTPNRPNICVICEKGRRGQVEQFLHKFKDGLTVEGGYQPFSRGFTRTYGLQDVSFTFFEAERFSADAYRAASIKALREGAAASLWHLAIIQTEKESRNLLPEQNPYLVAKAAFLSSQIPTQFVARETMGMAQTNLAYTLSNLALAIYAKLGGVPWLLKSDKGIAHEVVIGLGSAAIGRSRFERRERIVGITSVFRGDGGYLLANLSNAVPFESYKEALTESLEETLTRTRKEMNWMKGDSVRIVVHAFKPMRGVEIEAVKRSVQQFADYDLQFAFVHVKSDHPFLLFDEDAAGVKGRGEKAPVRGLFSEVGERDALLTLTGPSELKRPTDGMPRPLLLTVHPDSTFNDLVYLTRQAFWFSSHSWRSFLPAALPVTIYYSDLVADLLGRLDRLGPQWSPSVMLGKVGTTRWFL